MTDREAFEAAWKEYNTPEAFSEFGRELAYWGWQAALASERAKQAEPDRVSEYLSAQAAFDRGYKAGREDERAKQAEPVAWRDALEDCHGALVYIRSVHGDLYGVGWDRCMDKAAKALSAPPAVQAVWTQEQIDAINAKVPELLAKMRPAPMADAAPPADDELMRARSLNAELNNARAAVADQRDEAVRLLRESQRCLKEAKRRWTPTTTNSDADACIEANDAYLARSKK